MRKIVKGLGAIMLVSTMCLSIFGCGDDEKKSETTTAIDTTANEIESSSEDAVINDTSMEEETTLVIDEDTTTKVVEETTSKKIDSTTKNTETTKKTDTTTEKQTTTVQQTTTAKPTTTVQQTTTAKPTTTKPTTTVKQEDTTTKKQEETTIKAPEVPKTWFAKKGYKITSKMNVLKAINGSETREEYLCNVVLEESIWEENPEYKWVSCTYTDGMEKSLNIVAFDKYTGVEYSTGFEWNAEGYMQSTRVINGKDCIVYKDGAMAGGSTYYFGIAVPKDYDGVVFVCAETGLSINRDLVENDGPFMLDEYCNYSVEDVYFITVDDK